MVELGMQDLDLLLNVADETAKLLDVPIFARNCFRESHVEGIK